jgi:hypothetical protein
MDLTPTQFEELVGQLLAEMGFESIEVTKYGGDGGIDVRSDCFCHQYWLTCLRNLVYSVIINSGLSMLYPRTKSHLSS